MPSRRRQVGGVRNAPLRGGTALIALVASLTACRGDTLYDVRGPEGIDVTRPVVRVAAHIPLQMFVTDTFVIGIKAMDNTGGSGLRRVGSTVLALVGTRPDTVSLTVPLDSFTTPMHDSVSYAFAVGFTPNFPVPSAVVLQISGFAIDSAGNCAAATPTTAPGLCRRIKLNSDSVIVSGALTSGMPTNVIAKDSAAGGVIASARKGLALFGAGTSLQLRLLPIYDGSTGQFGPSGAASAKPRFAQALHTGSAVISAVNRPDLHR